MPGPGLGLDGHGPGHERRSRLSQWADAHSQHARLSRTDHAGFSADRGRHHREQRSARAIRRQGSRRRLARRISSRPHQRHRRCDRHPLQRPAGDARSRLRSDREAKAEERERLMDALPDFRVVSPTTLKEAIAARAENPQAMPLGGGTDLVVNIRRGIVAPKVLIDMTRVQELHALKVDANAIELGASLRLSAIAEHPAINAHYPVLAQAAAHIAGPTHRNMGTLGGNLCLDTRCIFYNQSEWWRDANNHCLKTTGSICHVAPKSRGVCFATFSGDLAPALLILDAEIDITGPAGRRTMRLDDFYIGYARQDEPVTDTRGDGKYFLALRPGEIVTAVRAKNTPGLRSAYDKIRIRRSIEYPVTGVAVGLRRDGDTLADLRVAFTGTNPRPVRLVGAERICGGPLDARVFAGLDALVRDQVMPMKTTFTPGHYRRRVAGVLARRLVTRLFES